MTRPLSPHTRALLRISEPPARPALAELARRASTDLAALTGRLSPAESALFDRFPLDATVRAAARRWRGHDHEQPPAPFSHLAKDIRTVAGDGFATVYGRLLLLRVLALLPSGRPRLRIPELVWEEVQAGLGLLVDAVPGVSAPDWGDQAFVKDLRAAQLQWLPYDGMVFVDARARDEHLLPPPVVPHAGGWLARPARLPPLHGRTSLSRVHGDGGARVARLPGAAPRTVATADGPRCERRPMASWPRVASNSAPR